MVKKGSTNRHRYLLAVLFMGMVGCIPPANIQNTPKDLPREYQTKTGKKIMVMETHPMGASLSSIRIHTKNFEHNISETIDNVDPISEVFMADLDANGFEEIYIITVSQGSGSYGNVIGFASNRDKSLSMVNFPEIREDDKRFEGYMGHDAFTIEGQKLIRTFPLYIKKDTNQNPTGGKRRLIYGLTPGEAMWQLTIEQSDDQLKP